MSDHTNLLPSGADTWLDEHPDENRDELERVWRLAEVADEPFDPDPVKVERLRGAIRAALEGRDRVRLMRLLSPRATWAIAASLAIIAFGAVLWLQPITYSAPPGETLAISLPDGSRVTLNSGTRLWHRRSFGSLNRSVRLEGEAFFEVATLDSEFEVATFNGRITVLGTRFNVRAWSDDMSAETNVYVEEGTVRVQASQNPDDSVILKAGQATTVMSIASVLTEPDSLTASAAPSWRSGGMAFTNRPLIDILDEVERRFGVETSLNPDSLAERRVSLYLGSVDNAGTVLELVAASHDLLVVETESGYELTRQ